MLNLVSLVFSHTNSFDSISEGDLHNKFLCMIIVDEDSVICIFWFFAPTDYGDNVGPPEHFPDADTAH